MTKPIKGYEDLYTISEDGVIHNLRNGNVLCGNINSYGYRVVRLYKNGKPKDYKLHQLLAKAFILNPNNYKCVNHIGGNKLNNSLDNLEWCDYGYNNRHAREILNVDFSKKPIIQTTLEGNVVAVWVNANMAANILNGNGTMISACCKDTTKTAYGYKWYYADDTDFFFSEIKKCIIKEKIRDLYNQLETL